MKVGSKGRAIESSSAANRAEDVRRKRDQRSQQRVSQAKQQATHPVRVRPVVVRGNAFGTPILRQKSQRTARRAFYVTMDRAAGTEVRLPSLPMLHPGWRLLSAAIAIAAMVGIYSMSNSTIFRLGGVEVTGLNRISAEEVNSTIDLADASIIEVDTNKIRDSLASTYPELVDIRVGVGLPNIVSISAVERQPVVIWQQGDQTRWIDAEGVIFPPRGDAGPLVTIQSEDELPMNIVADPQAEVEQMAAEEAQAAEEAAAANPPATTIPVTGPRTVDTTLLSAAQSLSQKLQAGTPVLYSNRNGLGWNDPQGWQVFIGNDLTDFEAKFTMYQGLVSHFNEQGLQPVLVSVEHLDAPFYRLEP